MVSGKNIGDRLIGWLPWGAWWSRTRPRPPCKSPTAAYVMGTRREFILNGRRKDISRTNKRVKPRGALSDTATTGARSGERDFFSVRHRHQRFNPHGAALVGASSRFLPFVKAAKVVGWREIRPRAGESDRPVLRDGYEADGRIEIGRRNGRLAPILTRMALLFPVIQPTR